jgi:antitoxin (DNA-binding transcriptional repressor) of toxin-antitoxin stability system
MTVNIGEAQTRLSELVAEVEAGEDVGMIATAPRSRDQLPSYPRGAPSV